MCNQEDARKLVAEWHKGFIRSVAFHSQGLPNEANVLVDLEKLRSDLVIMLNDIERGDERSLSALTNELAERFESIVVDTEVCKHRAKAAIATARAFVEASVAFGIEQKKAARATTENTKIQNPRFFPKNWNAFVDTVYKQYVDVRVITQRNVNEAMRNSQLAINKVVRGTRRHNISRWFLERGVNLFWSILILGIIGDKLISFSDKVRTKLSHQIAVIFRVNDKYSWMIDSIPYIAIVVLSGVVIEYFIRPRLEMWQTEFERSGLKRYASEVLNAAFTTRAYRVFVEASRFGAAGQLATVNRTKGPVSEMPLPSVPVFVHKSAPSIEDLTGLEPLPKLVETSAEARKA